MYAKGIMAARIVKWFRTMNMFGRAERQAKWQRQNYKDRLILSRVLVLLILSFLVSLLYVEHDIMSQIEQKTV